MNRAWIFSQRKFSYLKATALKITFQQTSQLVHNFPLINHQMVVLKVIAENFSVSVLVSIRVHVWTLSSWCLFRVCSVPGAINEMIKWCTVHFCPLIYFAWLRWDICKEWFVLFPFFCLHGKKKDTTGDSITQDKGRFEHCDGLCAGPY